MSSTGAAILRPAHATLIAALAIGALATSARAQIVVFTDRAAFEAALVGLVVEEDFNAVTPQSIPSGSSLDVGSLTIGFSTTAIGRANINAGTSFGNIDGTNFFDGQSDYPNSQFIFSFPTPVTAYGADYVSTTSGAELQLFVNGQTINFTDHLPDPGTGFLGVVSVTAFTAIEYRDNMAVSNEIFSLDNVIYGTGGPTPTPGPPTPTPSATATASPTVTPLPTSTAIPTSTSLPTATMFGAPTRTPAPTPSPADATPSPTSMVVDGSTPTLPAATASPSPSATASADGNDGSGAACPCGVGATLPMGILALALLHRRRQRA